MTNWTLHLSTNWLNQTNQFRSIQIKIQNLFKHLEQFAKSILNEKCFAFDWRRKFCPKSVILFWLIYINIDHVYPHFNWYNSVFLKSWNLFFTKETRIFKLTFFSLETFHLFSRHHLLIVTSINGWLVSIKFHSLFQLNNNREAEVFLPVKVKTKRKRLKQKMVKKRKSC